jgi:excisionase family DNA binding protein
MSNESQIMFVGVSPKELAELISENVKRQMQELLSNQKSEPQESEQKELITRKEAAELLKVSLVTIHEWSNNDILRLYKLGNRSYFKRSEILEKLFDSNRKKSI